MKPYSVLGQDIQNMKVLVYKTFLYETQKVL